MRGAGQECENLGCRINWRQVQLADGSIWENRKYLEYPPSAEKISDSIRRRWCRLAQSYPNRFQGHVPIIGNRLCWRCNELAPSQPLALFCPYSHRLHPAVSTFQIISPPEILVPLLLRFRRTPPQSSSVRGALAVTLFFLTQPPI